MLLCWHAYLSYWQKRFVLAVIPNAALADSLFPLVEEGPCRLQAVFLLCLTVNKSLLPFPIRLWLCMQTLHYPST